jgi:hypothetical protein
VTPHLDPAAVHLTDAAKVQAAELLAVGVLEDHRVWLGERVDSAGDHVERSAFPRWSTRADQDALLRSAAPIKIKIERELEHLRGLVARDGSVRATAREGMR